MPKYPDVKVELIGKEGNAFFILGRVSTALKRAGYEDAAKTYMDEARSGDYAHLLCTTADYVCVK